ncbi:MAG: SGNH/GDSL hydrolase family protein [Acidobacteriia bacterium]|nr:SGNH/GDSL hydrolase family protein [Terriglobia bacterium]
MKWIEESPAGMMAAMLVLGPVLLAQGTYVRRTALKLPEPEGPRDGVSGTGTPLSLLIIGDSAGAGVGAPSHDEALLGQIRTALNNSFCLRWRLAAKTGFTTRDAIRRLEEMPAETFDTAVISLGTNDVTSSRMVSTWLGHLDHLAALLRSKFHARQIVFSGVGRMDEFPAFPQPLAWYMGARARQFNRALQGWTSAQQDCDMIPMDKKIEPEMMAEDGFHPGPSIYALWGASVAEKICRRWIGQARV